MNIGTILGLLKGLDPTGVARLLNDLAPVAYGIYKKFFEKHPEITHYTTAEQLDRAVVKADALSASSQDVLDTLSSHPAEE